MIYLVAHDLHMRKAIIIQEYTKRSSYLSLDLRGHDTGGIGRVAILGLILV